MQVATQRKIIQPYDVTEILQNNFSGLMSDFYEMQSNFLSKRYKAHNSLETSNIIICLYKNIHLEIIRQREKNLDYDFSLNNFWFNLNSVNKSTQKIVAIVKHTGIPKETVRRKIKKLVQMEYVSISKNKEYFWTLLPKRKNDFLEQTNFDISNIAKFILNLTKSLGFDFSRKEIEDEIKSQFSFFWYHFLTCQLKWFRMWQNKIKDIDLILITLQALIPTLQYLDKHISSKDLNVENLYSIVGQANEDYKFSNTSISAASVSEVTGIPRATCIRKLEKLVKLGFLIKETKTKRYFVNQVTAARTKNIITQENVRYTIDIFSEYLSIIINALTRKYK